jgi:hypothetical protein
MFDGFAVAAVLPSSGIECDELALDRHDSELDLDGALDILHQDALWPNNEQPRS